MREYYVNNLSIHNRKSLNYRIKYKILQSCEQGEELWCKRLIKQKRFHRLKVRSLLYMNTLSNIMIRKTQKRQSS